MALTYSSNLIKAFFSECKLCKACVSQPFLISLSLRSRSSPWWIQLAFRPEFQLGFWSYTYPVCWLFLLSYASLHLPGKLQSMQTGLFFDGIGLRDVILVLVEHSVHWARPERVWRSASLLPSPDMCVVPASAPKFWQIDWFMFHRHVCWIVKGEAWGGRGSRGEQRMEEGVKAWGWAWRSGGHGDKVLLALFLTVLLCFSLAINEIFPKLRLFFPCWCLVGDLPAYASTRELFHLAFFPWPAGEGSESAAGWAYGSQPKSAHHAHIPLCCLVQVKSVFQLYLKYIIDLSSAFSLY